VQNSFDRKKVGEKQSLGHGGRTQNEKRTSKQLGKPGEDMQKKTYFQWKKEAVSIPFKNKQQNPNPNFWGLKWAATWSVMGW